MNARQKERNRLVDELGAQAGSQKPEGKGKKKPSKTALRRGEYEVPQSIEMVDVTEQVMKAIGGSNRQEICNGRTIEELEKEETSAIDLLVQESDAYVASLDAEYPDLANGESQVATIEEVMFDLGIAPEPTAPAPETPEARAERLSELADTVTELATNPPKKSPFVPLPVKQKKARNGNGNKDGNGSKRKTKYEPHIGPFYDKERVLEEYNEEMWEKVLAAVKNKDLHGILRDGRFRPYEFAEEDFEAIDWSQVDPIAKTTPSEKAKTQKQLIGTLKLRIEQLEGELQFNGIAIPEPINAGENALEAIAG